MNEEIALDQRNLTLVLNPGSHNFRLGRSTDCVPFTIPHCIARHCKDSLVPSRHQSIIPRPEINTADFNFQIGLKAAQDDIGKFRPILSREKIAAANSNVRLTPSEVVPPLKWTSTTSQFVIGEDALNLSPSAPYHLLWPLRYGRLNPELTITAALQDLEDIWTSAIEKLLTIPKKSFQHYRCVLIIPDIFVRHHIREMVNVLLLRMCFTAVIVHQENVCATFGIGLPTGCYVDIGDQKVSISCVDDGISIPESRITLDYGGSDITRVLHALLKDIHFPSKEFQYSDNFDCRFLNSIKDSNGHLDVYQKDSRQVFLQRKRPETSIFKLQLEVGDELVLAPLALFHPAMFCLAEPVSNLVHYVSAALESEPDDPFDDLYIVLTSRDRKKRDDGDNEAEDDDDENIVDVQKQRSSLRPNKNQSILTTDQITGNQPASGLLPLDEAIIASINRCESTEIRLKMFGCVIVVGEGLRFEGAQELLSSRLCSRVPPECKSAIDSMDVIMSFKDLNPGDAAWKGASLITCVDSSGELWISKTEWLKYGSRVIREKAPFVW